MPTIFAKTFAELSKEELYNLLKLRTDIFCFEQECVYQEFDDKDQGDTIHIIAKIDDSQVVGNIRLVPEDSQVILGRVVIAPQFRGTGLGDRLMEKAFEVVKNRFDGRDIFITSQLPLEEYYRKLGFITEDEVFYYPKDKIPHVPMRRRG